MRKLIAATVCLLALAWLGQAAAAGLGPYRGTASGNQLRNQELSTATESSINRSSYAGHFSYSFNVSPYGVISGGGTGAFDSATWHLQGSGDDEGENYNCDPPVRTSGFTVEVSGSVENGVAHVRFRLIDAVETNDQMECQEGFIANASTTSYLADSLQAVQPNGELLVNLSTPSIGNLVHSEGTVETRKIDSNWNITITPPPPPEDIGGGNAGPGGATGPNDPRAEICTIMGNRRNNVLNGTAGNDIICGFGGNDRINGRGGHDILVGGFGNDRLIGGPGLDSLYGNFGNDFLNSRDGAKDLVDGGKGTDRVRKDAKDRVRGVP
jgi:Ca2+-binding RTX toxin-like protein